MRALITIVAFLLLLVAGCGTSPLPGVYLDPNGDNHLIACEWGESVENGSTLLFCSNDERGVW